MESAVSVFLGLAEESKAETTANKKYKGENDTQFLECDMIDSTQSAQRLMTAAGFEHARR